MTGKPVVPRARARADVEIAIDYYRNEAGADIALDFVEVLEQAYSLLAENPAAGSLRWSDTLNLPGLRSWRLKGFPWIIFYRESDAHLDVWRVLHAKRNVPAWMVEEEVG